MADESPTEKLALVEVGRFERLSQAREHGLALAAQDLAHWIFRQDGEFVLQVEARFQEKALLELARYQAEPPSVRPAEPANLARVSLVSLYLAVWVMGGFWLLQNVLPAWWMEKGQVASTLMMERGEWWRALTALTLHADFAHLAANLATGLLFAAFLLPQVGSGGLSWLLILSAGALGNLLNAWFYAAQNHRSIGASTAVFGALGLLVGLDWLARLSSAQTRSRWQLILPIGAGLGLLAFLGAGSEHGRTDLLAHLWGFVAGLLLSPLMRLRWVRRFSLPPYSWAAGLLALLLLIGAWWLAINSR